MLQLVIVQRAIPLRQTLVDKGRQSLAALRQGCLRICRHTVGAHVLTPGTGEIVFQSVGKFALGQFGGEGRGDRLPAAPDNSARVGYHDSTLLKDARRANSSICF
ncbi:hypothetical protein SODG_003186 [Sodalis praecaptivus]